MMPLRQPATASFGLVLALAAHLVGWPVVRGGHAAVRRRAGDEAPRRWVARSSPVQRVASLDGLPAARAVLLDVTPRAAVSIAGDRLPDRYRRALERFRYGPGICKVDWALSAPIPWRQAELGRAGTVHLGGGIAELDASERAVHRGRVPERPFVLLVQPTVADPSRAPEGRHIAWAYAHVPSGSGPTSARAWRRRSNATHPASVRPCLRARCAPRLRWRPTTPTTSAVTSTEGCRTCARSSRGRPFGATRTATPVEGLYLCSSSTPPGGGVHGMSGHLAARSALRREFGISPS